MFLFADVAEVISRYTRISFILNIVGSSFGVIGMILYFVLFFTDRLRLVSHAAGRTESRHQPASGGQRSNLPV